MKKDIVEFRHKYQIAVDVYRKINFFIAGKSFDNELLTVDFHSILFEPLVDEGLVKMNLSSIGIEAVAYVQEKEIERILGVQLKYFDKEYIEYLVAQKLNRHGVHFDQWKVEERPNLSVFCIVNIGQFKLNVFLDVETLNIDVEYCKRRSQHLPGSLKLSTVQIPFETELYIDEIKKISVDDIVFVKRK